MGLCISFLETKNSHWQDHPSFSRGRQCYKKELLKCTLAKSFTSSGSETCSPVHIEDFNATTNPTDVIPCFSPAIMEGGQAEGKRQTWMYIWNYVCLLLSYNFMHVLPLHTHTQFYIIPLVDCS